MRIKALKSKIFISYKRFNRKSLKNIKIQPFSPKRCFKQCNSILKPEKYTAIPCYENCGCYYYL